MTILPGVLCAGLVGVVELSDAVQLVGLLAAGLVLELHVRLELGPLQHCLDDTGLHNTRGYQT